MPKIRLSRSAIDKLPYPGKQTIYWDTRLTGFGVRVNEHSRAWLVRVRIDGVEYQEALGRCNRIDIDVAYNQAKTIIEDAAQNITPEQRRILNIPPAPAAPVTLQTIYTEYLSTRKLKPSSIAQYQEYIDNYCADWLHLPVGDISPDMIIARHREISTHAPVVADNVLGLIRALLNYTVDMYDGALISRNPCRKLGKVQGWTNPQPRTSHLSAGEIGPWVDACLKLTRDTARDALLFLLHTGARRDEALTLKWENVNLEERTVTLIDTKNGIPLTIPICEYLVELLKLRKERRPNTVFVFPSRGTTGRMTDLKSPLKAIVGMGGKLVMTHDLRRTFLTICEELDIGVMTRKKLVNHSLGGDVTSGYTQVSLSKMRQACQAVADYIKNSQQILRNNMQNTGQ